jgi:outer membrane protein assembly factor BamB
VTSQLIYSPSRLVTLSARDGSVQKEQSFREDQWSGTTLSDGVMYLMNGTLLNAYRISDGSSLWRTTLVPPGGGNEQGFSVYTDKKLPLVADGMVYVRLFDQNAAHSPTRIYALRASNGSIAWTLFYPSASNSLTFTAGSGLLVLSSREGGLTAYHASNGSLAWKLPGKPFSNENDPSYPRLFFAHATFYFMKGVGVQQQSSVILAINPDDGHIFWQKDYDASFGGASITDTDPSFSFGTHVYLHALGSLYALDATNGDLLWQRHLGRSFSSGAAVEAHGVVYVPDDTLLYALNAHDGSQIWQQTGNALSAFGTPLVLQNVILVSSSDAPQPGFHFHLDVCPGFSSEPREAIFALNARDGSIYWRSPNTAGSITLSPTQTARAGGG